MGFEEMFYWKGCFICSILFIYSQIEYRKKLNCNEGAEILIYVLMKNKKKLLKKSKKGQAFRMEIYCGKKNYYLNFKDSKYEILLDYFHSKYERVL